MTDTVNPKTLLEAVRYYTDPKVCFETMLKVKWPDGKVVCPKCGHGQVYIIRTRSLLQCKSKTCKKQFNGTTGTMFDGIRRLDVWLVASWCIANDVKIGSSKLAELTDATQKAAWLIQKTLKTALELV